MKLSIEISDLQKICDVLAKNEEYHRRRDEMNAALHMGQVRYSPLTSETMAALERLTKILHDLSEVPQ